MGSICIGGNLEKIYGIELLTFDEVMQLPSAARQTRNNKVRVIDMISGLRMYLDSIESTARKIPELDDQWHANLVQEFTDAVKSMQLAAERAVSIGRS